MKIKVIAIVTMVASVMLMCSTGCLPESSCPQGTVTEQKPGTKTIAEDSKLVVVSNKEIYDLSEPVIKFIETRGVPVVRIEAGEFDAYKKAKYIVVLAGPNASAGAGDIARQLLSAEEQDWTSQTGNKKMYLKMNKWCDEQYILVFAGFDANATYRTLVNTKEQWWAYISSWFNIELTHEEVYGY